MTISCEATPRDCAVADDRDDRPLAALLRRRLSGSPAPVLLDADRTLTAASLWVAARALVARLRAAGLRRGDRVLVASGDDLVTAIAVTAGISGGFATALLPRPGGCGADVDAVADAVDARLVLVDGDGPGAPDGVPVNGLGIAGLRSADLLALRPARHAPEPDVAVLLSTSGTTGAPTWVALSEHNLASVITSHADALFGTGWDVGSRPMGVMASVLPWQHAFGLVLDLLLGLVAAEVIVRDREAAADPDRLAALLDRTGTGAWLSAVPRTLDRLLTRPDAAERLAALAGGLVGGAPASPDLCAAAEGTRLRPGYGLTEAGPGVCLGDPGRLHPGLLGTPVGCTVRVRDGELVVTGANVSLGALDADGRLARRSSPDLATGDLVGETAPPFTLAGRTRDLVKLDNGRWALLPDLDRQIGDALGRRCAVLAPQARRLLLLVDGDERAVRDAVRWLGESDPPWAPLVHAVHGLAQQHWPRTPKGAPARYGELPAAPPGAPPTPVFSMGRTR